MGRGISLKCKCGNRDDVMLGVGMMYPEVFRETMEDIQKGVYGDEWKLLCEGQKYMAVDAGKYLFYCTKCGCWEVELGLDLYEPNDVTDVGNLKFGIKTVEEWGEIPYLMDWIRDGYYHLLKEYMHSCPKCKNVMIKTKDIDSVIFYKLRCKECSEIMSVEGMLMWD